MKRESTTLLRGGSVVALGMLVLAGCGDDGSTSNALTSGTGGYVTPRAGGSGGSGGRAGSGGGGGAGGKAGRGAMIPVGDLAKAVANLTPFAPPSPATAGAGGAAGAAEGTGAGGAGGAGGMAGAAGTMMAGAGGASAGAGGMVSAGSGGRGGSAASGRGGTGSAGRSGSNTRGGAAGRGGSGGMSGAGGAGAGGAAAGAGGAGAGAAGAGGAGAGGTGAGGVGGASSTPLVGPQGNVTFTNLGPSVEISIAITQCQSGKSYPIHIHSGMSCADEMSQGGHWDPPRGEGIPDVPCTNAIGTVLAQREATDEKPWTVGGAPGTNVIGHVIVLHDPDMPMKRIACGEIKAAPK